MDLVGMLYNMHIKLSNDNNPPFTHKKEFDKKKINCELMKTLQNRDTLKNFSIECIKLLKEKHPQMLTGSVHYCPISWVVLAYNTVVNKLQKNLDTKNDIILYPNGCCSKNDCSINLFYDVIHERLFTK